VETVVSASWETAGKQTIQRTVSRSSQARLDGLSTTGRRVLFRAGRKTRPCPLTSTPTDRKSSACRVFQEGLGTADSEIDSETPSEAAVGCFQTINKTNPPVPA